MSFADTKPLVAVAPPAPSYPAEVGPTAPAVPHQGMIWLDDTGPELKVYDNGAWISVSSVSDSEFIPFNNAKFSAGKTQPAAPVEGEIWFDQNQSPPVCNYFENGAWHTYDFVNPPKFSLGFLGDLVNVELGKTKPDFGDALVFDPFTELWKAGSVPAHIYTYGSSTNYAHGATVYYNGGLFQSNQRTIGDSPQMSYGDAVFYKRSNVNGTGQFLGPFQFDAVEIGDPTVAPAANHGQSTLPHYTLRWQDDAHFAVWVWDVVVPPGYRPGVDPMPTFSWHNLSARYSSSKMWRAWSAPQSVYAPFSVWIYDNPRGNTVPHFRKIVWNLLEMRKDLGALHDVIARNPATGDTLVYFSDQNWYSQPRVVPAPATPTAPGSKGQTAADATHVYLCVDENSWVRVARDTTGGW